MLTTGTAVIVPGELARVELVHEPRHRGDRRVLAAVDAADQRQLRPVAPRRAPRSAGCSSPASSSCSKHDRASARSSSPPPVDLGNVRRRPLRPREVAGGDVLRPLARHERRILGRAERLLRDRAARMEAAAGRQVDRARRVADDARGSATRGPERAAGPRVSSPCVYGCRGFVNSSSVGAVLDDPPQVHHRDAVARRAARPPCCARSAAPSARASPAAPRAGSAPSPAPRRRAPTPARRRRAAPARAPARARSHTRCRCPPENCRGCASSARGPSPTRSSSSRQRASTRSFGTISCARSSSASVCRTVMRGLSDEYGSWNTIWIRRRCRALALRRQRLRPR